MVGLLLLTYGTHPLLVVGFAVIHGIAWGLRGPFMQAMRADYFGLQAIGMSWACRHSSSRSARWRGPMVAGILADATGNYPAGFTVALIAGSGSLLFLLAKKPG